MNQRRWLVAGSIAAVVVVALLALLARGCRGPTRGPVATPTLTPRAVALPSVSPAPSPMEVATPGRRAAAPAAAATPEATPTPALRSLYGYVMVDGNPFDGFTTVISWSPSAAQILQIEGGGGYFTFNNVPVGSTLTAATSGYAFQTLTVGAESYFLIQGTVATPTPTPTPTPVPDCTIPGASFYCASHHDHVEPYSVLEGLWVRRECRGCDTTQLLGNFVVVRLDDGSERGLWFILEAWRGAQIGTYESRPTRVQMQYDPVCNFGISLGFAPSPTPTPPPTPTPTPLPSPSPTPLPTATPLPFCVSGERPGNPPHCRCRNGWLGQSGKCR